MAKTKRLALLSLLTAIALTVFVIEAQIPVPVPIPGVKLGLANIITLAAMVLFNRRDALAVLAVRLVLGSMFTGGMATLLYSAAGGLCAYGVMCLLVKQFPLERLWIVSAFAAIAHNAGQLTVGALILKTWGIWVYAPILAASGIITGTFTGFAAIYLIRALRSAGLWNGKE